MFNLDVDLLATDFAQLLITFGTAILIALIVLVVGWIVIKWLVSVVDKIMQRRSVDVSLRPFLKSILSIVLKIVLIITVIGIVGIETTSFIAVIGSAGLAIGLALQGSLANFAGGVLILTVKPFRVGDFIEAQGKSGTVTEIKILNTTLTTPQNQVVFIPNGKLAADVITNYNINDTRRLDLVFGIGYDDDILKAKKIISDIISSENRVLEDPIAVIGVEELADSSVNIKVKLWCHRLDYWDLMYDLIERVKLAFDSNDITIPYPQRDVHMKQA